MHTTLITAAELAQNVFSPNWIVLDCRHDLAHPQAGIEAYHLGHIPNAQFAALDTDLADLKPAADGVFRGRHPLPVREAFIERLRSWGVNPDSQVVACDAHGGMFAARLWWMLRWVGHAGVAVLDGGLAAWQAQGERLSIEHASKLRGTFSGSAPLAMTVSAAEVLANLDSGERVVLDARAPDRFKPAAELRAAFEGLITNPAATIAQCGSGVTACHNLLAMEIAGLPGAALYPGSWSEWCANPARPVATQ
jgi:thiosulfate/3-mercaptopyruvate sulfurtransferase